MAKGRHYPLDCVAGWVVGHGAGWLLERAAPNRFRCIGKVMGGCVLTAEWGWTYFIPLVSRNVPLALSSVVGVITTVVFYLFYSRLFLETFYKGQSSCLNDQWECR